MRRSSWLWPALSNGGAPPFAIEWNVKDATSVVLGQVDGSGNPFLMQSAPILTWAQWQAAQLNGQPLNGPKQDPDGDGVENLMEFIFGSSPTVANSPANLPFTLVDLSGSKYLQVTIPRLANRHATLVVEVSSNLVIWNSGASFTTVVSSSPTQLVVRDLTPLGPAPAKRFFRLRASVPAP